MSHAQQKLDTTKNSVAWWSNWQTDAPSLSLLIPPKDWKPQRISNWLKSKF